MCCLGNYQIIWFHSSVQRGDSRKECPLTGQQTYILLQEVQDGANWSNEPTITHKNVNNAMTWSWHAFHAYCLTVKGVQSTRSSNRLKDQTYSDLAMCHYEIQRLCKSKWYSVLKWQVCYPKLSEVGASCPKPEARNHIPRFHSEANRFSLGAMVCAYLIYK